jgi:hypothetical protein
MTKNILWLGTVLLVAGISACTAPWEQLPEQVVITAEPTIRLPLGDPLKGEDSLGAALQAALDIDASRMGLMELYDYTDPEYPQDRKFLGYQTLIREEIALGEYQATLQPSSDDLTGLPSSVQLKDYLPPSLSLPTTLEKPLAIPLNATLTIEHEKIKQIQGTASGLTLVCKGSKTIPDSITVKSPQLQLDSTKTKEKGDLAFGPVMTFTGGDFTLNSQEGVIQIAITITMTFTEILDTKDISLTPAFIFNWTQAELDLQEDLGENLLGTYPDLEAGGKPMDVSSLKESLFKGKLQFQTIPLYVYVNGPRPWFEDGNMRMNLALSYRRDAGDGEVQESLHQGPIDPVVLPGIQPKGTAYSPKTGVDKLSYSIQGDVGPVFNQYPKEMGFTYGLTIDHYRISPAMLKEEALVFEAAMVLVLPLTFTVGEDIDLAEDMDFALPDFGDADMLGREAAGAGSQVFDFVQGMSLELAVDNQLGLDGEIRLYANKLVREAQGEPLDTLGLTGKSSLELSREELRDIWPFSPAFDICIPQGRELVIHRTVQDNPFSLKLSLSLAGSISQEINL